MEHSTYQKLVIAAANLLRKKGYAATGISDILRSANVTRGSLYHHFPGGKSDLAIEASKYSCMQLLIHIEEACDKARASGGSFHDAMVAFCEKIFEIFQEHEEWRFMTVSSTLQEGGARNEYFCSEAQKIYLKIMMKAIDEGGKFGISAEISYRLMRKAMIMLEGAWMQARVLSDHAPMRSVIHFMEEDREFYECRQKLMAVQKVEASDGL